jgi:hypothetical protein
VKLHGVNVNELAVMLYALRAEGEASEPPWATAGDSQWMVTPSSPEPSSEMVGVVDETFLGEGQHCVSEKLSQDTYWPLVF